MDNEFFVMFALFLIDPNWWQNENHWSCFSKLQACKEFLIQFHLHFCRKEKNNETPLARSLGRGFWSRIPAPFPRQFCISRTSVISIPSNVFFPNTATLAKSRFPSSDQIPYPVNKFCVFPNHRRTVFRLYPVPPDSRPSLRASESIHAKAKSSYVNIKTTWSCITVSTVY